MTKLEQALTYSSMLPPIDGATATTAGNLDTQGADYATIVVHLGVEANTNAAPLTNFISITESDDTVVTNFATFDSNMTSNPDNTAAAIAVHSIDLKGRKRYLRVTATPATHTTNGVVTVTAVGILNPERRLASAATNQVVG